MLHRLGAEVAAYGMVGAIVRACPLRPQKQVMQVHSSVGVENAGHAVHYKVQLSLAPDIRYAMHEGWQPTQSIRV